MSSIGTYLSILVGPMIPIPAPFFVTEALDSVEVTQRSDGGSVFQMNFHADRTVDFVPDFPLVLSHLLSPGNRVILSVLLNNIPFVLMDGIITDQTVAHKAGSNATISVQGEDISILMDRMEVPLPHPMQDDFMQVGITLAKYAWLGIIPVVIPTLTSIPPLPLQNVPYQYTTDRAHIRQLAERNGNIFVIRHGPLPMMNIGYWGPPLRLLPPQPALTVDMGAETNVDSITFKYSGDKPTIFFGSTEDKTLATKMPVFTMTSMRMPPFALEPPLLTNPLMIKKRIFKNQAPNALDAQTQAQGLTDKSTDDVVTANGTVDGLRYNWVLQSPGIVGVRGCGLSYDGMYVVTSVTHSIERGKYTQNFSLAREGIISSTPVVLP